jgi:alcohol dehydrogenase
VLTTSEALVTPFDGADALLGTNPIAIGFPAEPEPMVLDMSTALQYPLGARTKTAHGLGNALLMPAAMRLNLLVRAPELACIGEALGLEQQGTDVERGSAAIAAVRGLAKDVGIPPHLRAIGVRESDLEDMAQQAIGIQRLVRNNPRPVTAEDLLGVLREAFSGQPLQLTA